MKLLYLIAIFLLMSGVACADPKTVNLCFNNYPPYVIGDETRYSSQVEGVKVDIASTVFKELKVPVNITIMPFARCLSMVESGAMDGALPLSKNDEREKYMAFSHQANPQHFVFVYKKSRFPKGISWKTYNDISDLRLGINFGSYIDKNMEVAFSAVKPIERPTNIETMITMLEKERIDLGAMDKLVALHMIRKLNLVGKLDVSEQTIGDNKVYFGISRKSEAIKLLPAINRILDRMNMDGSMVKLIMEKSAVR
jgi:polar amino acid transport system substrate-binding protein